MIFSDVSEETKSLTTYILSSLLKIKRTDYGSTQDWPEKSGRPGQANNFGLSELICLKHSQPNFFATREEMMHAIFGEFLSCAEK
jgi:hypothetical protein